MVSKFSSLHRRILVSGYGEARSKAQRAEAGGLKGREQVGALGEGQQARGYEGAL